VSEPRTRLVVRPEEVSIPAGHPLRRLPFAGGLVGVLGILGVLAMGAGRPQQMFAAWLVAFLYFLSLALGALYLVLIFHAVQAGWGVVVRRLAEIGASTIPLFALLFVPIVLGMRSLYPWTVPGAADHDPLLRWKAPYLNPEFFLVRAGLYFAIWSILALAWARASRRQDVTGDLAISERLRRFSGPALLLLALTQTFASFDWIMSLTPAWYSTIFGVYFFAGAFVSAAALLSVVVVLLQRAGLLREAIGVGHLHDLGKLVFAFSCFWAYIAFSQFFLIWYGNIPEETIWYRARLDGSWKTASAILAVGHFIIPFFFFMGRTMKRRPLTLALGASWVLLMHLLDIHWLVMPTIRKGVAAPSPLEIVAFLGVGGIFVAAAGWMMQRQPLVPVKDPRLPESLSMSEA
jgi:hypothetical protein